MPLKPSKTNLVFSKLRLNSLRPEFSCLHPGQAQAEVKLIWFKSLGKILVRLHSVQANLLGSSSISG